MSRARNRVRGRRETVSRQVSRLQLPGYIRRLGRGLLDQQLWCWGRDIVRDEGNLLVEYGFSRERPPEGESGSSLYLYYPTPETRLVLWGFGVFYGAEARGGVYLRRRTFSPALSHYPGPEHEAWRPGQLSGLYPPREREECRSACILLRDLCRSLHRYETWILASASEGRAEHRKRCVTDWPKTVVPAEKMPESWLRLTDFFNEYESREA